MTNFGNIIRPSTPPPSHRPPPTALIIRPSTPIKPMPKDKFDIKKSGLSTIAFAVLYKQGGLCMDLIEMVCEEIEKIDFKPPIIHRAKYNCNMKSISKIKIRDDTMSEITYYIPDIHFITKRQNNQLVKVKRKNRIIDFTSRYIGTPAHQRWIKNRHRQEGRIKICSNCEIVYDEKLDCHYNRFPVGKPIFEIPNTRK